MTGKQDNTNNTLNQQQQQSQQEQAATREREQAQAQQQKPQRKQPTVKNSQGEDVPYFPAPQSHATGAVTRLHQRAREMAKQPQGHTLPPAATDEAKASASWVPLPAGGLAQLARDRFPDDVDDEEAMDQHLYDLLTLNRDLVRDDTNATVGQHVRVPA